MPSINTIFSDKIDGKTYLKNMIAPVCIVVLLGIIQCITILINASESKPIDLGEIPWHEHVLFALIALSQIFFVWRGLYYTICYLELGQYCTISFAGRMRRKTYWGHLCPIFFIFYIILQLQLSYLSLLSPTVVSLLGAGILIYLGILGLAYTVQRLHDVGKSGSYYFIILIPFYGIAMLLIALTTDSVKGENEYGPNPKGIN